MAKMSLWRSAAAQEGEEAALFAHSLLRMYTMWACKAGAGSWKCSTSTRRSLAA